MTDSAPKDSELAFSRGVLRAEAAALHALADRLGPEFERCVALLASCAAGGGTVQVTGLGKSGLVGAKIAATMSSLGIPSHTVHPTEAAHGDLGRFRPTDLVIAISYSGETDEVVDLCSILKQDGLPIIGICNGGAKGAPSSLERLATVTLRLELVAEAGAPHFVAPTSSTTATMALGDALALATARRMEFTDADFARRHPGGSLGSLLKPVRELLRYEIGKNLPAILDTLTVDAALREASRTARRPGAMLLIESATGRLSGIFTDGDLRRLVLADPARLQFAISDVMTRSPRTLPETALVRDAVRMVREHRQDEIPVVDAEGRPIGILDVQDLIAMKLVQD